jgi:hypothetical protein
LPESVNQIPRYAYLRDGQFPGETKAIAALWFLVPVNLVENWEYPQATRQRCLVAGQSTALAVLAPPPITF